MGMEIRQLRHVLMVARHRGFGAAAEHLGITQSALSRSVSALEEELGLKLFDRGKGGTRPTRAGETLLTRAARILDDIADLKGELDEIGGGLSGHVRVGVGPLLVEFAMKPLYMAFLARPGSLRITTETGAASALFHKLLAGQLDCALCSVPAGQVAEGIDFRILSSFTLGLLCRPGHPLEGKDNISAEDIASFPMLGGSIPQTGDTYFAPRRRYNPQFALDHYRILAEIALETDALVLATPFVTRLPRPFTDLVPLDWQVDTGFGEDTVMVLATRTGRTLAPAARALTGEVEKIISSIFQ